MRKVMGEEGGRSGIRAKTNRGVIREDEVFGSVELDSVKSTSWVGRQ